MQVQEEQLFPVLQLKFISFIFCFFIRRFSIGSIASGAIEKWDANSRSDSRPCFSNSCLISLSIVFLLVGPMDCWTCGHCRPYVHKAVCPQSNSYASTCMDFPLIFSPAISVMNVAIETVNHIAELPGCLVNVPI